MRASASMKAAVLAAVLLVVTHRSHAEAKATVQAAVYPGCPCGFSLLAPTPCKCDNGAVQTSPVCPSNYWFYEEGCECVCSRYATCPTNHKWDVTECGCFCDTNVACPEYYEWDVSQCKCICNRLCPYGKVLNTKSCTCECPNKCDECELLNPSNCNCEKYSKLLAVMTKEDTSLKEASKNQKGPYEYRAPK